MPKAYIAIRDKLIADGMSPKQARQHAARIYNAKRKKGQKPVTGKHAR